MGTAWLVIALNVVFTIGILGWARATHVEPAKAIAATVLLGLVFYALIFLLVIARRDKLGVEPVWISPGAGRPVAFGVIIGVAAWGLVAGIGYLATGHLIIDPTAGLLVAGGNILRVVLAVGLLVVVGPWIEELLFRGLVLESLRPRSVVKALLASSVLFAICHLHGIIYYSLAGALLGGVYLKSGLKASLSTHAAFNACFVVTALAVSLGPAHAVQLNGLNLRVPATWRAEETSLLGPVEYAAAGPLGAQLSVISEPMPLGVSIDAQQVADRINEDGSGPPLPGMTPTAGAAHVVSLPAGDVVEFSGTIHQHAVRVAFLAANGRGWTFVLLTGGSGQAVSDFNKIMSSVSIPVAAEK